jgi:hypothetical protein
MYFLLDCMKSAGSGSNRMEILEVSNVKAESK